MSASGSSGAPHDGGASGVLSGSVERAAYRALLGNAPFRNLFLAMLTSSLGDWIGLFAILALTESLAGASRAGAFALSGIMVARVLPTMILGPVAGVFVDRWDRKRTLIVTDVTRGVLMALLAFAGDVFQLAVATFLIEVMSTLFIPAKDATLPNLVRRERLVQANQLSLMVTYGTLPLGAAMFAALVGLSNLLFGGIDYLSSRPSAVAIWINALTFFASALFIRRIRLPHQAHRRLQRVEHEESPGAWTELKEGIAFIVRQPLVRALIVGVMGAFLAAGVVASGVGKLFTTILNAGDSGFGILGAVVGVGLFLGLLTAGPVARRLGAKERVFAPGLAVAGAALVGAAFSPRLDIAMIPAFIMGYGAGMSFVTGYTMLQEYSSDEVRGRTFAAFNTGVRAALFASLVVGPFLVGVIGVEGAIQFAGGGFYPYSIGGVRITLALAGLVALGGAFWSGRQIHQVLSARPDLDLQASKEPAEVEPRYGLFVVFEGGEGSGKSTQIRLLRDAIERAGFEVVTTREPGGTAIGERIREMVLDPSSTEMSDRAEALLYAAARAQHVQEVIRPALEEGAVVLCDRWIDSSVVYQGQARGLGEAEVEELNRWGTGDLLADLTILLDIDPIAGLQRAGASPDRLEAAGEAFHRAVNSAYRRRADHEPSRYLVLDGSRPVEELHAEIHDAVMERLGADDLEVEIVGDRPDGGTDTDVPPSPGSEDAEVTAERQRSP